MWCVCVCTRVLCSCSTYTEDMFVSQNQILDNHRPCPHTHTHTRRTCSKEHSKSSSQYSLSCGWKACPRKYHHLKLHGLCPELFNFQTCQLRKRTWQQTQSHGCCDLHNGTTTSSNNEKKCLHAWACSNKTIHDHHIPSWYFSLSLRRDYVVAWVLRKPHGELHLDLHPQTNDTQYANIREHLSTIFYLSPFLDRLLHTRATREILTTKTCSCAPTPRMVGKQACAVCKMAKLAGDETGPLNAYVSLNQFHLMFWVGWEVTISSICALPSNRLFGGH